MADLVDVSVAVYVADRLALRRPPSADKYEHHWQREMRLQIPVREPERWQDPALLEKLTDVLGFLTEDIWRFDFRPMPVGSRSHRDSETLAYLFPFQAEPPVTVALFSGGLDSLAGLVADLAERPSGSVVVFSGLTNKRIGQVQRSLLDELALETGREAVAASARFGLHRRGRRAYDGDERTQRTRAFAFLALGAVTAIAAGGDELRVYENGIGAINLPYTDGQLGGQSTRAMHPSTIRKMSLFVRHVLARQFDIKMPFQFHTKGDLCRALDSVGLAPLAARTVSCDGFPQRVAGSPQCGICTSCLLRRQGLAAAGLGELDRAPGQYRCDVLDPNSPISSDNLYALRAMMDQAYRLRCALGRQRSWLELIRQFPTLLSLPSDFVASAGPPDDPGRRLADMYGRYCDEWTLFARCLGDSVATAAFLDGETDGAQ
jgi:hypothetical protein